MMKKLTAFLLPLLLAGCMGEYKVKDNTVTVPCGEQTVRLQVISPGIVRVSVSPDGKFPDRESLAVVPQKGSTEFEVTCAMGKLRLITSALAVEVYKGNGSVNFYRADGTPLALDGQSGFTPIEVEGKKAWSTCVSFESPEDEAFYGLGQHQAGELNHKGRQEELFQYNTKVSVPMVVSSKGYGLMFDA